MLNEAQMLLGFRRGLRNFLRAPVTAGQAAEALRRYLDERERSFLQLMDSGVYGQPRSPWRALLLSARIELGDLSELVHRDGLESALARLYDAGVYMTVPETRGKQLIVRNGLEIRVGPADFDNSATPGAFAALTGGSNGARRRLLIDFALLNHDVHAQRLFLHGFDLDRRPTAIWRPVPPGGAGLKRAILQARCGAPAERWFSQIDPSLRASPIKSWALLQAALAEARRGGTGLPVPEYVPLDRAGVVVDWLASAKSKGSCAHLDTIVSSAIRVCQAAAARGLDISGSFFRVGSETLSESHAAVLRSSGTSFACHYSMSETGPIGIACRHGSQVDDVHALSGKIAILPRPAPDGRHALFVTTLLAGAPHILLNVESGDSAEIESRSCACPFGAAGYRTHLHTIRSYEKVSGEGMYILGTELAALVEHFLPQRFGGAPTDYQFVYEQRGGLNRVRMIVSKNIGDLEIGQVRDAVLQRIAATSRGDRMKAQIWSDGDVLTVERGEPAATPGSKILPVRFTSTEIGQ